MEAIGRPNLNRIPKAMLPEQTKLTHLAFAHMLSCSLDLVQQNALKMLESGSETVIEANPGIKDAVDNSSRPYLEGTDAFTIKRLAIRAARIGDLCLSVVDAKNEISRTLGVAYAIMKLVDQQPPLIDPEGTLAAAAMGIVMESDDENDEVWKDANHPQGIAKRILEKFQEEAPKP